jgi:hypothetical protein
MYVTLNAVIRRIIIDIYLPVNMKYEQIRTKKPKKTPQHIFVFAEKNTSMPHHYGTIRRNVRKVMMI